MANWTTWCVGMVLPLLALLNHNSVDEQKDDSAKVVGTRDGNRWIVPLEANGKTKIPRAFASLRSAYFQGYPERKIQVKPEIEHWTLGFNNKAAGNKIVLEFDSYPATKDEIKPIEQLGDGTLTLPCSMGVTKGKKLRFEPQPHKNTIGYWADSKDSVSWTVAISKTGEFNVGLLQGCGKNCGGTAKISLLASGKSIDAVDYEVKVTGHFQNFVWQHAGSLKVAEPGEYTLKVEPVKINGAALMDVRQIHLSPVPAARKKKAKQ